MLFNLNTIKGEERDFRRVGRFFNLLSSSSGQVFVRILDAESREIFASKVLNGDAVELDRMGAIIYVSTDEDATVTLFWSQTKLVNNGVTIKAAGGIATKRKLVDGLTKLNSITAQNQRIDIKALGKIFIGNQVACNYSVEAGQTKELPLSGDLYAVNDALKFTLQPTSTRTSALLQDGANTYVGGVLMGEKESCYVYNKGNSINILVKDNVQISGSTVLIPSGVLGFSAGWLDSRPYTFFAGEFYIYLEDNSKGAIVKTADFESFETVKVFDVEGSMAIGGTNYLAVNAENFALIRSVAPSGYKLTTGKLTGNAALTKDFVDVGRLYLAGESVFMLGFQKWRKTDIQQSAVTLVNDTSINTTPGMHAQVENGFAFYGANIRIYDNNMTFVKTIAPTSLGTGIVNLWAKGDHALLVSQSVVTQIKISTSEFSQSNVSATGDNPTGFNAATPIVVETTPGEHAILEVRGQSANTSVVKTELVTVSGTVKASIVEIAEMF